MAETRCSPRGHASVRLSAAGIWNGAIAPGSTPAAEITVTLSAQELATRVGRSTRNIRRWAQRGDLVPIPIGGGVFYRAEDVRRLISDRMVAAILTQKSPPAGPNRNDSSV